MVYQLPRAKREAKKGDWSTKCLVRSEMLKKEETGLPSALSEARGSVGGLVEQLPQAKQESKKGDWSEARVKGIFCHCTC